MKKIISLRVGPYYWEPKNWTVQGRTPNTKEDITQFINRAVILRVNILIKGELEQRDWNTRNIRDKDVIEMMNWARILFTKPPKLFTWKELITLSMVFEYFDGGYIHYWRQAILLNLNEKMLDTMVENTIYLLYQIGYKYNLIPSDLMKKNIHEILNDITRFGIPINYSYEGIQWFTDFYQPVVSGIINILLGENIIIELAISDHVELNHQLLVHLNSAIVSDRNICHNPIKMVLIPNLGIVYRSHMKIKPVSPMISLERELLYRVFRRKLPLSFDEKNMIMTYNILDKKKIKTLLN